MQTVRRLYFYAVAIVSLEVVIWGAIGLAQTLFNRGDLGRPVNQLASSLSLILVGVPVFLIHWGAAQRDALRDPEERTSRIRAVFFYVALACILVPMVQNTLAIANRLILLALSLQFSPLIGSGSTWSDNLVAIAINAGAAVYILSISRKDWAANLAGSSLVEARRLYRYLWVLYGLGITVFGVQQVLQFIFLSLSFGIGVGGFLLADGLALLLVGVPVWILTWQIVEDALNQPGEQESLLRLVILYLLALGGVGTVLTSTGLVVAVLLNWVLGQAMTVPQVLEMVSIPISIALPMGGVWAFYGRHLKIDLGRLAEQPRRAGLHRLYSYILSGFGLAATFLGSWKLLWSVIELLRTNQVLWGGAMRDQISSALAALMVGLPLWWLTWRPMEFEALLMHERGMDAAGDHARRSVVRKAYLYLALFSTVIGVMASGGQMIFDLASQVLGNSSDIFLQKFLDQAELLVLFAFWLVVHLRVLRRDGRLAGQALAARHGQFPVVILEPGDGDFSDGIMEALQRQAPAIPAAIQRLDVGIPGPELSTARAAILPSTLVTHPPEAVRLWLQDFAGQCLIVPTDDEGWLWIGAPGHSHKDRAQQVTQAIRQMAEGQPVHLSAPVSAWMLAAYILGGLFALLIGLVLVILVGTSLSR